MASAEMADLPVSGRNPQLEVRVGGVAVPETQVS